MPVDDLAPRLDPHTAIRRVNVRVVTAGLAAAAAEVEVLGDQVAVEAPLEVRLDGAAFAVTMRTPGDDEALGLGFLLTEGVIAQRSDVVGISQDAEARTLEVRLASPLAAAVTERLASKRQVATSSSCGMCGRASLASLTVDLPRVTAAWQVAPALVAMLPQTLATVQETFRATGGLHAAALVDRAGRLQDSAEDVGRHNAVDKLLGRAWRDGRLPLSEAMLMVSGRTSFEIVQKAWYGGIPLVAAVSAPSSLAIDLAHDAGITLLGFVRDSRFNVYAHPERIDGAL